MEVFRFFGKKMVLDVILFLTSGAKKGYKSELKHIKKKTSHF